MNKCLHINGHLAIQDMAMNRFLFVCKDCGHHFNLWNNEFSSDQLDWLVSKGDKFCKFKFITGG